MFIKHSNSLGLFRDCQSVDDALVDMFNMLESFVTADYVDNVKSELESSIANLSDKIKSLPTNEVLESTVVFDVDNLRFDALGHFFYCSNDIEIAKSESHYGFDEHYIITTINIFLVVNETSYIEMPIYFVYNGSDHRLHFKFSSSEKVYVNPDIATITSVSCLGYISYVSSGK